MKLCLALFSVLLFCIPAKAQVRLLMGGTGGSLYDNVYGGGVAKLEVPILKKVEVDLSGQMSPHFDTGNVKINLLTKVGLGSGSGWSYGGLAHYWFTDSWAVDGGATVSEYEVPATSKTEYFGVYGFSYRLIWFGVPSRIGFHYIREFKNGLMANEDESNHLNGGQVTMEEQFGCKWHLCFRLLTDVQTGVVKNQGNPVCDGTFAGPVTCPRPWTISGGASVTVLACFPRGNCGDGRVW